AVLEIPHRIGDRFARLARDEHAVAPPRDLALPAAPVVEEAVHHRRAARVGHELAKIADEAAGGRKKDEPEAPAAGGAHFHHLALALAHLLHHDARMLLVDVDHSLLDRLEDFAIVAAPEQHLRPRDAEFEALAAHGLDQDRELQFAPPRDHIGVGIGRLLHFQRDIALGFLEQAVADDAARHLVALG